MSTPTIRFFDSPFHGRSGNYAELSGGMILMGISPTPSDEPSLPPPSPGPIMDPPDPGGGGGGGTGG